MSAPASFYQTPGHGAYYQRPGHVITVAAMFFALDIGAIILRFVARKRQKQAIRADDWFMVLATVLTLIMGSDIICGVSHSALASHQEIPPEFHGNTLEVVSPQMTAALRTQYIFTLTIPLALGCIKLSILLYYFRLFAITTASKTYILLAVFTVFTAIWTVAFFFTTLFQCGTKVWALTRSTMHIVEHCPGSTKVDMSLAITDFVTDVIIIIVPLPSIWRMHLSTSKKIGVSIVFLLGSITIITSMIRLISNINLNLHAGFNPNLDGIVQITEYLYWGLVEAGTGVFAGCPPVFQVLIRRLLSWESLFRSTQNGISSVLGSLGVSRSAMPVKASGEYGQLGRKAPRSGDGSICSSISTSSCTGGGISESDGVGRDEAKRGVVDGDEV